MDSLTHIVLGAVMGEAVAGKQLKEKAMIFGAIAQSIPDIDIIAGLWTDPASDLLAHRGFTHSILFSILLTPVLAWMGNKKYNDFKMSLPLWIIFLGSELLAHIILDAFNAYGTGWFEPFSHLRISFNSLFVIDPLFTIWPLMVSLTLILLNNKHPFRKFVTRFGLMICCLYLTFTVWVKFKIDSAVDSSIKKHSIHAQRYFSTPTSFNSILWFIAVEDDSGFHLGYRSIFDQDKDILWHYNKKNDSLLVPLRGRDDVNKLIRFSNDYYVVNNANDNLIFSDLRFGEMAGWDNLNNGFVFQYDLQHGENNKILIQRGRFSKMNNQVLTSLWNRMKGTNVADGNKK